MNLKQAKRIRKQVKEAHPELPMTRYEARSGFKRFVIQTSKGIEKVNVPTTHIFLNQHCLRFKIKAEKQAYKNNNK